MDDAHTEHDDEQIATAYARLGTALAPPPDIAGRVESLVVVRRRRRRLARAGMAGVVVAGVVCGAVLLGSGDDPDGDTVATDRPGPEGSFVVTRTDGSTFTVDDLTVSCDRTPDGEPAQAGHIYLSSPFRLDASADKLTEPFLYFEGVVAKIDGTSFTLPYETDSGSSDNRAFTLFAADSEIAPGAERGNEVSSAEAGAAGTVQVVRAACDPVPVLELEVDTTLGSEIEQGTYTVVGSFG
jgi:hypothetical protein